jgi:biopolymer transport protein TolQ
VNLTQFLAQTLDGLTAPASVPVRPASGGAFHVDIVQAASDSDIVGVASLIVCLVLSLVCWAVILAKWNELRRAESEDDGFVTEVGRAGGVLEDAYSIASRYPTSSLALILREACMEMEAENWYSDPSWSTDDRLTAARIGLDRVIDRTIAEEERRFNGRLVVLATTASVAPFIGLFGTVWGVLAAFQALGQMEGAAIQALAPGMATALLSTLAGLVAAIPATLFYNYFASRVENRVTRMEGFAGELANIIQKRLLATRPRA